MSRVEVIKSKVVGVSHKNPDGTDRQSIIRDLCGAGCRLNVFREPNNPHSADGTAVSLWLTARGRHWQLGYIRDGLSADVTEHLNKGGAVSVLVLEVTGGTQDKPSRGVNIQIELIPAQPNRARTPMGLRPAAAPGPDLGDLIAVAWIRATRGILAGFRAIPAGYLALPEWAQPIVWGVVGSGLLVVVVLLIRFTWK